MAQPLFHLKSMCGSPAGPLSFCTKKTLDLKVPRTEKRIQNQTEREGTFAGNNLQSATSKMLRNDWFPKKMDGAVDTGSKSTDDREFPIVSRFCHLLKKIIQILVWDDTTSRKSSPSDDRSTLKTLFYQTWGERAKRINHH